MSSFKTYKDLNVYQRAYKVAIDLHRFLESDITRIPSDQIQSLKSTSREVLGNIAESFSQRSLKAKRFFNFKALDQIRTLQLDLDFLHDIQLIPGDEYSCFYSEYDICAKMLYKLNHSLMDKERKEEVVPEKVAA